VKKRKFLGHVHLLGDINMSRRSLEWLGQVIRMDQTRVVNNVFKARQKVEEKWEDPD
jgi:hypothetical protein